LDSLIFSYYNHLISVSYEDHIKNKPFNSCVVAYRKIPVEVNSKSNKCNIDFAKETFEFIDKNRDKKLSVIVADITNFFDNLDHSILKKQWYTVLGKTTLPKDHYNVFKALTRIKYVNGSQLFDYYDKTMYVERGVPNESSKTEYKRIPVEQSSYFKEKRAVAYCTKPEFLKNNKKLIISKNNTVGIPQGSAISATLANIYMLDFDNEIYNKVVCEGGYYQRYSDDLIIVCEQEKEDEVLSMLRSSVLNLVNLEIHRDKTKVYRFENLSSGYRGFEIDEITKKHNYGKTLTYLGFTYDGNRVLIKTAGFSKYYRSMKRSFKKSTSLALYSKNPAKNIFKSRLYRRFTYKGANRKMIYQPSPNDKTKYVKSTQFYWGNYLSYVYKANKAMISLNGDDVIKRQSRKFWSNFHKLMKHHQKRVDRRFGNNQTNSQPSSVL